MKKIMILLSSMAIIAFVSTSCDEKSAEEISINQELSKPSNSGNQGKVTICHYSEENDSWNTITVSENAVDAHLGHGDSYPNEDGTCGCSPDYSQDFSENADGWNSGGDYGNVTYISTDGNASLTGTASGPYTYYGDGTSPYEYRATWPTGGWYTTLDVYLDPNNWADNTGFDFSVAARKQDESHLRDYIFHVGVVNGYGLLVNASNNADFSTNSYKLLNENEGNYYTVPTAGWYTFRHVFYDDNGALAVDLQLLDSGGELWSVTRTNAADLIASIVGGNSYGWFTHIDVSGEIMIDNQAIYRGCQP